MKLPFSSRPLYWKLIGWGIIGVVVSFIWLQIDIGHTVTRFQESMIDATNMETLSTELTLVLGDFGSTPGGAIIIGNLGLVSIAAGIGILLWRKSRGESDVNREAG